MAKLKTGPSTIVFGLYLLLIFSLGLMKPSVEAGFASLTPTDLVFPILLFGWLIAIAVGSLSFRWRLEFLIFTFYFLALTISSIFSADLRLSFVRLGGVLYLVLLAVVGSNIVTTFRRLKVSVLFWLAGAVLPLIAALIGTFLFYFDPNNHFLPDLTYHYGAVPVGNFPRISSTFISPSMFCNYLTVTLVFALMSARMKWIASGVATAIIFAIGVSALFTVSIALGGVALAGALWVSVTNSKRTVRGMSFAFGSAVAIAFLIIAPFALMNESGTSFLRGLEPSSRFLVWCDAFRTFLSDPSTGRGLGTAVANVTFRNYDGTWSMLTDAHNSFLSVAAQSGILGLAALIAIVIAVIRAARGRPGGDANGGYIIRCLQIGFFTAFVYEGLTGSFEEARHLWVLIGIILAASDVSGPCAESVSLHRT